MAPRTAKRLGATAAAALSGLLCALAFATALEGVGAWVAWIALAPLLWAVDQSSIRGAAALGLLAGIGFHGPVAYWLPGTVSRISQAGIVASGLAWVLYAVATAAVFAVAAGLGRAARRGAPAWLAYPAAFAATEVVIPQIFAAPLGATQATTPIMLQVVEIAGLPALTFLVVLVNVALVALWARRWTAPLIAAGAVAATVGYGVVRVRSVEAQMAQAPALPVAVVQPGLGHADPLAQLLVLQTLTASRAAQGAKLAVWPESTYGDGVIPAEATALPQARVPLPPEGAEDDAPIEDRASPIRGFDIPVVFGTLVANAGATHNSALMLSKDGTVRFRYDKSKLVPVGESLYGSALLKALFPAGGGIDPGGEVHVPQVELLPGQVRRLGVAICYEVMDPGLVRRQRPDVLLTIASDAWFGMTLERDLHLLLAIPRTVENRAPMIRAALTGVSVVVDPVGRIVTRTHTDGPASLLAEVPLIALSTPYQSLGDLFAALCGLVIVLATLRRRAAYAAYAAA